MPDQADLESKKVAATMRFTLWRGRHLKSAMCHFLPLTGSLMFALLAGLASNASGEESPPTTTSNKKPKIELPRIVIAGDFGDAVPENIEKVLETTAEQLLRHTPERRLGTILVSPSTDVPITLFAKGPADEYQIRLATRDRFWAQYAYQFAHEVCHVLCNYDQKRTGDKQWFEEALCETASLFALKGLAVSWKESPPYPNWKSFAESFQHYVNDILSRRDRRLPPDQSLPEWYRRNAETLRKDRQSTERTRLVATYLLSLFEDDPTGWQALTWINTGEQDSSLPFPEYLAGWKSRCPERHRPFVHRIETLFGLASERK